MNTEKVKAHIREVENIYDKIENAVQRDYINGNLEFLLESFQEELRHFDYGQGDLFFVPYWNVSKKIESLEDKFKKSQFKTAYKTVQSSLLSIVKKYLSDIKRGFQELGQE